MSGDAVRFPEGCLWRDAERRLKSSAGLATLSLKSEVGFRVALRRRAQVLLFRETAASRRAAAKKRIAPHQSPSRASNRHTSRHTTNRNIDEVRMYYCIQESNNPFGACRVLLYSSTILHLTVAELRT